MAVLPDGEYGTSSAASVITNMLIGFPNIRVGLMVGIGGGAPTEKEDIRLGDIVVSSPKDGSPGVYQYDFGKTVQGKEFVHTGFLNQPSTVVRSAVAGLRSKYRRRGHCIERTIESILQAWPRLRTDFSRPPPGSDLLYISSFVHTNNMACDKSCATQLDKIIIRQPRQANHDNPYVHHGIIASGNQLMKDALVRDRYAEEKDILCFEMEAAGIMNQFPCLVIRGICDYSDSHKNKDWQGYAAMVAAAYAKDLLGEIRRMAPGVSQNAIGVNWIGHGATHPSETQTAASASSREKLLEMVTLERVQPQWATISWFDEVFESKGLCPAIGSETLTRMISDNKSIGYDLVQLTIQARSMPFAHGTVRKAFYARTEASDNPFVLKTFIDNTSDNYAQVIEVLQIQTLCKAYALEFDSLVEVESPLDFVVTAYFKRGSRVLRLGYMLLEQFVEGEYVVYNNNAGWVNEELSNDSFNQLAQAFSHFTFERSRGLILVSCLRGVDHLLTDPAVHTRDTKRFKVHGSNLNEAGFKFFFATHECNKFCRELGLKSNREMFDSNEFEYRKEWPIVTPHVCCSNKFCRGIIRVANSYESLELVGYRWCSRCWKQLNLSTRWRSCIKDPPKHYFEVSSFFYESQGRLPPVECRSH